MDAIWRYLLILIASAGFAFSLKPGNFPDPAWGYFALAFIGSVWALNLMMILIDIVGELRKVRELLENQKRNSN